MSIDRVQLCVWVTPDVFEWLRSTRSASTIQGRAEEILEDAAAGRRVHVSDVAYRMPAMSKEDWRRIVRDVGWWMRDHRGRMSEFARLVGVRRQRVSKWFHLESYSRQELAPEAAAVVWQIYRDVIKPRHALPGKAPSEQPLFVPGSGDKQERQAA